MKRSIPSKRPSSRNRPVLGPGGKRTVGVRVFDTTRGTGAVNPACATPDETPEQTLNPTAVTTAPNPAATGSFVRRYLVFIANSLPPNPVGRNLIPWAETLDLLHLGTAEGGNDGCVNNSIGLTFWYSCGGRAGSLRRRGRHGGWLDCRVPGWRSTRAGMRE